MAFDKDRDETAFNLYEKLYKGMPWELFDFKNLDRDSNGYIVKLKKIEECEQLNLGKYKDMIKKYGGILCLSGDADVGMKLNCTFYKNEELYKQVKKSFNENPEDLMHKESNFSLIAVNGGMNCRKGFRNCFRDIFPRFLFSMVIMNNLMC